jgi:Mg/Co/Ni transporter MgtE
MSGGSWDYCYHKIDEMADKMSCQKEPLRRAFGEHLRNVAKAMHDVEWVDSCDTSPGDERAAIELVLGKNAKALELEIVKADARKLIEELTRLVS